MQTYVSTCENPTGATLFAGFEGAGLGMKAAGIRHLWGIELDPKIAAVSQANGFNTIVADILDCDPADYTGAVINFLHASPPCPNFSTANASGEETELDIALAQKTADFITTLLPDFFTLENVFGYRLSKSWEIIARALLTAGYSLNYWHICTADYGVPQTRRRMIVIARRDGIRPMLPPATHAENPQAGLFGTLLPWVGWYEAIEDLIPGLPESKFADWQLKRLPDEIKDSLFIQPANSGANGKIYNGPCEPARTVDTSGLPKAFLPHTQANSGTRGRYGSEPATTLAVEKNPDRAFILTQDYSDSNTNKDRRVQIRNADNPITTIRASEANALNLKAFIMEGNGTGDFGTAVKEPNEPSFPIVANAHKGLPRARVAGKVVQMSVRCLARFQSFPDSFILPSSKKLACTGVGNALPPLFAQRLYESLIP